MSKVKKEKNKTENRKLNFSQIYVKKDTLFNLKILAAKNCKLLQDFTDEILQKYIKNNKK